MYMSASVCLHVLFEIQQDKKTENSHLSNCLETHLVSVASKLPPPRIIAEFFISAEKYQAPV